MNTEQLIADTKARFNHNAQRAHLKDKYQSKLIFSHSGGMWTACPQFIAMLKSYPKQILILIDNYGNPIQVARTKLLTEALELYDTTMREYLSEWKALENKR